MIKKAVVAAVAIALTSGVAQARDKNELTKQEGVGMFSGAAAGAIVGGPIGAMVGLMVGGILGDNIGTAQRAELHAQLSEQKAQQLEQDLIDTRIALAKASERSGGDEILDALAQRLRADVMFRTNGTELDSGTTAKLQELGGLLAGHQQLEVQLHGFADPRGKAEENLKLSLDRASAVRDALIAGGAAPEQIQIAGYGEELTTAQKGDLEAYAWERRVSLAIRPLATTSVAKAQ